MQTVENNQSENQGHEVGSESNLNDSFGENNSAQVSINDFTEVNIYDLVNPPEETDNMVRPTVSTRKSQQISTPDNKTKVVSTH